MRSKLRYALPLVAASILAGILAPIAGADTTLITDPQPSCTQVAGSAVVGGTTTECSTPGNVQLNATPEITEYPYPWADEFYGPAMIIGGGGYGPAPAPMPAPVPHGGGGGGGGGGR